MRFEYLTFIGLVCNLLAALMLPNLFLPELVRDNFDIESQSNYDFDNDIVTTKQQENIGESYTYLSNSEKLQEDLISTDEGVVSSITSTLSALFDPVFNALKKIGEFFSFVIPFGTLLFALPGALGFFAGFFWSFIFGLSFVNWIRGR